MKKKIFAIVFVLLLMIPVFSLNAKEKGKVKVYVFESGGCPYCESELDYLKGLDSYNKKFVIERRELYIDHVDWAPGRDYELGKAVAEKFQEDGFKDAAYNGTPFVVISDVYAAATYSTDLESYINKAYKEGDKDIVNKIAKKLKVDNVNRDDIGAGESSGNTDTTSDGEKFTLTGEKPNALVVAGAVVLLVGAMVFIIKTGNKNNKEDDEEETKENEEKDKEEVVEEEEEIKEVKKEKPATKKPQTKTSNIKKTATKNKANTQRKTNKK